jgi:hypothetical protein
MVAQSKYRVIGAFVVGFAIVVVAYTVRTFNDIPKEYTKTTLSATVAEAPTRIPIDVKDSNQDGIEDWREDFISGESVVFNTSPDESYELPETLTGQVGIAFLQDIIRSEGYGAYGKSKEEVVNDTVKQISVYATDEIFDVADIIISTDDSPEAVRTYANAHADAIINNSVPGLRNEALILRDVLNGSSEKGIEELKTITAVYLNTRNAVLNISVPPQLVKEHLDLINIYNALYKDIESMSKANEDPMLSLVRLKRYEDDVNGLVLAMQNIYSAIEPYASAFTQDDSALLFVSFSPNFAG